jgi:hypothetical protein
VCVCVCFYTRIKKCESAKRREIILRTDEVPLSVSDLPKCEIVKK